MKIFEYTGHFDQDKWTGGLEMPEKEGRDLLAVAVSSHEIFITGGDGAGYLKTFIYDTNDQVWIPKADLDVAVQAVHAACDAVRLADGTRLVIVVGGEDSPAVSIYNVETDTWQPKQNFPHGAEVNHATVFTVPDSQRFFMVGGQELSFDSYTDVYEYHYETDTWSVFGTGGFPSSEGFYCTKLLYNNITAYN